MGQCDSHIKEPELAIETAINVCRLKRNKSIPGPAHDSGRTESTRTWVGRHVMFIDMSGLQVYHLPYFSCGLPFPAPFLLDLSIAPD